MYAKLSFSRMVTRQVCAGIVVATVAVVFSGNGAVNYPPPTGVYCSCGPTTGKGSGSVEPAIAAKAYVKGILVRVAWSLVEPSDGTYDWGLVDSQITAAKSYGKKISLGIGNGPGTPQWLFSMGAQRLISTMPMNDTIAVPWDSIGLAKWTSFVSALGARYRNDTTIRLVYITNSSGNGYEMQMPFQTTPTLSALGYSDEKMIQSWEKAIDAFNAAFPNHYLTNDFHPVNFSDIVADSVYAYARNTVGGRYGANAWWWTQNNANNVYTAEYAILKNSAQNNAFSGVQFAYSGTTDSAAFGSGGLPAALQLAIDDHICYWELWDQDLSNQKFDSLFSHASCSAETRSCVPTALPGAGPRMTVTYHQGVATVVLDLHGRASAGCLLSLFNAVGRQVWQKQTCAGQTRAVIPPFPAGVYLLEASAPSVHWEATGMMFCR